MHVHSPRQAAGGVALVGVQIVQKAHWVEPFERRAVVVQPYLVVFERATYAFTEVTMDLVQD